MFCQGENKQAYVSGFQAVAVRAVPRALETGAGWECDLSPAGPCGLGRR